VRPPQPERVVEVTGDAFGVVRAPVEAAEVRVVGWNRTIVPGAVEPVFRVVGVAVGMTDRPRLTGRRLSRSREQAVLIPGGRLVPLGTANHVMCPDERSWTRLVDEADRFLAED